MEGFEGLDKMFNLSGTNDTELDGLEAINKELQTIEEKKLQLQANAQDIMLIDQQFLVDEMKTLIMGARTVMRKLETDLKIGASPRQFEVYAELMNAVGNQYKSLLDLNKIVLDAKIKTNQMNLQNNQNNKVEMTSEQLLDLIDNARKNSQMNDIHADFSILDENEDEDANKDGE
jgi:hypothetical protein